MDKLAARFRHMAKVRRETANARRANYGTEERVNYGAVWGLEAAADAYDRCAREVERAAAGEVPPGPGEEWGEKGGAGP
jgi:hypothetical protein